MKVAYFQLIRSGAENNPYEVGDYQSDMLYHGLIKLLGAKNVSTDFVPWWMYASQKTQRPDDFKKIWGKGFTVYGLLSDDELPQIFEQGTLGNYDIVVIAVHHTLSNSVANHDRFGVSLKEELDIIGQQFDKSRIVVIDGWDRPEVNRYIANRCTYFKRELYPEYEDCCKPISFAFPAEKIPPFNSSREHRFEIAPLIPVNQSIDPSYMQTYKYDDEKSYYDMYGTSTFALTSKKGGWDTLRHYEIMANYCLPIFVDIENCPPQTLFRFPKELCKKVKELPDLVLNLKDGVWKPGMVLPHCGVIQMDNPGYSNRDFSDDYYVRMDALIRRVNLRGDFTAWLKNYGTTEALAKYVINTCLQ